VATISRAAGAYSLSSTGGGIIDVTAAPYSAVGDGSTNDQAALAAALAALTPGDTLLIPAGMVFAHNSTLTLAASGVVVRGGGELKATVQTASAFTITGNDVLVEDVTLSLSGRTSRGNTPAHCKVVIDGSGGGGKRVTLRRVTVNDSHTVGIFVLGGQDYLIDACVVNNTAADGIHSTGGATRGVIRSPRVNNSGDDGIAVISYADETICSDISVYDAIVKTTAARGLAIVGGTRIRYHNCEVNGSTAAGVIVACEQSWLSHPVTDAVVERVRLSGCNTGAPGLDHGSVLVISDRSGLTCDNILISDVKIRNTTTGASRAVGAYANSGGAVTNLRVQDINVYGTGPQNFATDLAGTAYKLVDYRQGDGSIGWELLGQYTSSSSFASSGAITIPQRDMLQIVVRILNQSGAARPALRFNGDTGSNYWNTFTLLAGTNTATSAAGTMALLSTINTAAIRTIEATIANNSTGWQKPVTVRQAMAAPGGTPEAGHTEWGNTSAAITSVELLNDGAGVTFGGWSGIMIFGRNFS